MRHEPAKQDQSLALTSSMFLMTIVVNIQTTAVYHEDPYPRTTASSIRQLTRQNPSHSFRILLIELIGQRLSNFPLPNAIFFTTKEKSFQRQLTALYAYALELQRKIRLANISPIFLPFIR